MSMTLKPILFFVDTQQVTITHKTRHGKPHPLRLLKGRVLGRTPSKSPLFEGFYDLKCDDGLVHSVHYSEFV